MNWLNIYIPHIRAPEFLGCDPVARATWFCVLAYCADQENGGTLAGAKAWKDRQWQQLCGVTLAEVNGAAPLLAWQGDDLIVWSYPTSAEAVLTAKREGGRKGGLTSAKARLTRQPQAVVDDNAKESLQESLEDSRNEKKRKEKEGKRNRKGNQSIAPVGASRARNELLDALATVGGGKPEEVTQWGPAIAARAEIVVVSPDVTPDEVRRRAVNYRTHFDGAALTPTALSKHWAVCAAAKPRATIGADQVSRERAAAGGQFAWEKGGF
jgi:hypothetical protein